MEMRSNSSISDFHSVKNAIGSQLGIFRDLKLVTFIVLKMQVREKLKGCKNQIIFKLL